MIPITRPTLSNYSTYANKFKEVIESRMITNGKYVKKLEEEVSKFLKVKYCVAVSSCTSGLMLVLKGLGLKGEIVLPSFTFSATGHALLWNNLIPVFADIDEDKYTLNPQSVEQLISKKTGAILATHVFGNPCQIKELERIARKYKIKLIFDAAHAFGSEYAGRKIGGFGDVEVFSCSPTKLLVAGEGGLITTNNKKLADFCRIGKNYGDDGKCNIKFNGLNARMSEFHAIIALESLKNLKKNMSQRNRQAAYFKKELKKISSDFQFQKIDSQDKTTYKDFVILIDKKKLGFNRDELARYLLSKNIIAKAYFYPPLHLQKSYKQYKNKYHKILPITNKTAKNILSLPMYSHITKKEIDFIIKKIQKYESFICQAR